MAGKSFTAWIPSKAFVVRPEEGAKLFEVILKGEEEKVIEVPVIDEK